MAKLIVAAVVAVAIGFLIGRVLGQRTLEREWARPYAEATPVNETEASANRATRYESACQIVRKDAVEIDAQGNVDVVDFELEWDPCPGDQFQVIRGDKEFAACAAKYEVGNYVPVIARRWWDQRGFYRWDIERMGDCPRKIEPDALGSYEKSSECRDMTQYGKAIGFACSRQPFRNLVERCPWMARR